MKKLFAILAVMALVFAVSCEKRSPWYTTEIKPIVTIKDISVEATADKKTDITKEVPVEAKFNIEITDAKKDVIWKIKDIDLTNTATLTATTVNKRTKLFDTVTLDKLVDGEILYDKMKEAFITKEQLSGEGDITVKSQDIKMMVKKASELQPAAGDAVATTSSSYVKQDGIIEVEGTFKVTLETQDGATRQYPVKLTIKINGNSDKLKEPTE